MWRGYNLNDRVRLKLTVAGRQAWRDWHDALKLPEPHASSAREPRPDGEGWIESELWHVMQILGPALYMGGPQLVVDNEIRVFGKTEQLK